MNTEKQRASIIHICYIIMIIAILYIFLRYVLHAILPFLIGFTIAFMLRPIIKFLTSWTHGHEKLWAILIIVTFYTTIATFLICLTLKGFSFLQDFISHIPILYERQIEPFLHASLQHVESVWKPFDFPLSQAIHAMFDGMQNALSSIVTSVSEHIIHLLTNFVSALPNFMLSFVISILSSFFFNADYSSIITFFTRLLSYQNQQILFTIRHFITNTLGKLILAYTKLMLLTFIELCIGFSLIGIEKAMSIAFLITLFDILPIFGTGGVLIPWIFISFLNHQPKQSIALAILYLIVVMVRTVLEPRIIGKQIGLHPLVMLFCIYVGAKLFGLLGIFLLPMIVLIAQDLNKNGILRLYPITNKTP